MSQLKRVEKYARKLHEGCQDPVQTDEILQTVHDISAELISNIAEDNLDTICSLLFSKEGAVLCFLSKFRETMTGDIASAVSEILKVLCTLLKKRRKSSILQRYAKALLSQCTFIAKKASANNRSIAIEVIMVMVDPRNRYDPHELNVPALYEIFSGQYITEKKSAIVKAKILELLGTIARFYPQVVTETKLKTLKRWCFDSVTHQVSNQAKSAGEGNIISGGLTCINSLLRRPDLGITCGSEESNKLFDVLVKVLIGFKDATRFAAPLSALVLFRENAKLFGHLILPHCEKLYDCLQFWASHHNVISYKFGVAAYEEFLRQLSVVLYENIEGIRETAIFAVFMQKFNKTLEAADSLENIHQVSAAIRSIGYFSKIFSKKLNLKEIDHLRNSLVRISDWFYSEANNNQRQYLRHLPAFIKSYTLFAEEFETVPVELMETIHQMCDIFITRYHDISGFYRRNGCLNIRNLLTMLYKKSEGVFGNFANAFFQKALICTCTTIHTLEEEEDRPLYTELLYFWEIILGRSRQQFMQVKTEEDPKQKEDEEEDEEDAVFESVNHFYQEIDTVDTEGLSEAIYDAFMANSLKLIKTFNLKLRNIDEDDVVSDEVNIVSKTLCPVNQKDFILFQNFVKFWSIIFEEIDHSRLTHWVYIASTTIIDQSVLHPLVSGFYRMQAGMMIVCERLQFFKRCHLFYTQAKSNTNKDILPKPQEYVTYLAIREYMKEVWHRLQQFTDELLASCLHLILSYPVEFFDIGELITPLEKALKLGITYHPLAAIAMDSLEKLLHPNLNYNIDSTFLSRILPCINEYLLVGVVSFNEEEGIKRKDLKIPTSQQRRYEVANTKKTAGQLGVVKRNYSDLPALQRRMMQFLGKLGGKNKQLLLKDDESLQDSGMLAWDPEKRVELRIPFKNVKVTIYLDEYLPRICELAEFSPDRQTKIAACELLHGLVLYMLGSSAIQAVNQAGPKKSLFHIFYLHIFPVMLKLAIDPDQIAREMFQALYAQVIHWLTNNAQSENNETIALLQALLEASCSSDAGLRDYGAECIQEFVKWSIKQTSRSTDSAHNIRSLLRRLYNLMTSPSTSKRFGASLVFNRIYRLFREEPVLVNSYTLEILGQLFVSLKIAESDHPSVGTRDQIIEAISHIRRIIREKSSVFLIQNDRQAFIGNQSVKDLVSLVLWTFEQSGKLQRTYAKVCINFFTEFCVFLPGIKTPKQWLSAQLSANSLFLINIFETDQLKPPSVADDDDNQMMTIYLHWIKRLNSTVDGYIWLVERQIIDPFTLLGLPSSIFLLAVSFFVRNTPFDYLEEKLEESVIERNKLLSIYTHIATRLIYFFDLVLRSQEQGDQCYQYLERVFMDILCHKNFTNIVASTLLLPKETSETIQSYQGNAITQSGVKRMFGIAKSYILIMKEKSCWKFIDDLTVSIIKTLQSKKVDILIHASLEMERSVLIEVIQTVDGIRFLQSVGLFHLVCQQANELNEDYPKDATEYCKRLFDNYLKSCKKAEEPLQLQLTGNSIAICFTQLGFAKEYAPQLLGISGYLQPLEKIEKTEIFQKHAEYMVESIANHFEVFSLVFKENISSPVMREYLFLLFEFLESNKLSHRKLVWNITNHIVDNSDFLRAIIDQWSSNEQLLDLVAFLKLLFNADPGILTRGKKKPIFDLLWKTFVHLLHKDNSFKVKNSALDLLPVFICIDKEFTEEISEILNESFIKDAPNPSSLLKKGTAIYNEYISVLDKLLNTMITFKSAMIFKLLKVTFIQEEHHIHEQVITSSVESFSKNLGLGSFLDITQSCFELFKSNDYVLMHRKNLVELIISLFTNANDNHVIAFYERNISYILGAATAVEDKTRVVVDKALDWGFRACCLRLVQVMYERLSKEDLDKGSRLNQAWLSSKENTRKKIMHASLLGVFTAMRNDTAMEKPVEGRNEYFYYNQATVNAMMAALLRMSDKPGLYEQFFCKGSYSYIWSDIIDTRDRIYLTLELDQPMPKKRIHDLSIKSGQQPLEIDQTKGYMASMDLIGSSLTQATLSEMVLQENQINDEQASAASDNIAPNTTNDNTDGDTVMEDAWDDSKEDSMEYEGEEFEIDVLNQKLFMRTVTAAIQKLHTEITPPGEDPIHMPKWMQDMNNAFTSNDDIKIQVYMAKLIVNCPFAFEKYAEHWVLPLMTFVTQGHQFGTPINYLTQDLCIILAVWGRQTSIPSPHSTYSRRTLFEFFEYLISNAYHHSPRITRSNIQIIRGIFENWGKCCPIPTKAIYKNFTHPAGEEHKNIVGLQFAGIVYSNGGNIYDSNEFTSLYDLPEPIFFSDMAKNIMYKGRKSADIPANAAELMSWSLKFMKDQASQFEGQMRIVYSKMLSDVGNSRSHSEKQFLKCMNRIYLHDIELGQELLSAVTYRLNRLDAEDKVLALNYINACWSKERDQDIYNCLYSAGIPKNFSSRDENLQIVILKVLNTIFEVLKKDQVKEIIKQTVDIFSEHTNEECRSLHFEFLKKAYEGGMSKDMQRTIKAEILKGLVDKDERISFSILDFVKKTWAITDDIRATILTITSELFMDETQDIYLLYATRIVLDNTRSTYDINEPLFDKPLPEARFDAGYQKINTNWQHSTSYMMPLFSASQTRTLEIEDLELELRKTQSLLEFSTTQGTGRSLVATFNPDTQEKATSEKLDDFSVVKDIFAPKRKVEKKPSPYYNKRFLVETKGVTSRFHADRNEQLQKKYRSLLNSMKEAGEKKVSLSREYRVGELPDVQIPRRDLIFPLEILAKTDHNISRLLYSSLMVSIVNEMKQESNGEEYQEKIIKMIDSNLRSNTVNFTPTTGSFLRIIFDLGAPVDGLVIKEASSRSYNHHIGIAILEKQLSDGDLIPRPKKKAFNSLPPAKEKWIHLALLYQHIDELEIFQNTYLANVATNEYAKAGVKAQNGGDYATSFNHFDEALNKSNQNHDVNVTEKSLWEQQMLYCRTQLGQWDLIARDTLSMTENNLERLWDDCQDPYLEYFMRSFSKLKKQATVYQPDILEDSELVGEWTTNHPNPIYQFLDEAYENEPHKRELFNDFACEWTLVEIYRQNYSRGRQLISKSYDSLLNAWTTLHPLAHTSRLARLGQLQRTVELEDYLNLHKSFEDGTIHVNQAENFVKQLMMRYPDTKVDRMDVWYDILYSRFEFLENMKHSNLEIASQLESLLDDARGQFLNVTGKAALEQHNTTFFTIILDKLKGLNKIIENQIGFIEYTQHESEHKPLDRKPGFIASTIVKSLLFTPPSNWNTIENFNWKMILVQSFDTVKNQIIAEPTLFETTLNTGKQILRKYARKFDFGHNIENADVFVNYLEKAGYDTLVEAGQLIANQDEERSVYLWKFGRYCDEALHVLQDSKSTLQPDINVIQYSHIVIENYFEVLDHDNKEALEFFPRLLELVELYPDNGPLFKKCSMKIDACWKFIRWIPQLVSSMATPIAAYIFPILTRIAESYPRALYYSFQMSCEFYELKKDKLSKEVRHQIEKIMHLVRSPIMEQFSYELKRLSDPDHIAKDFVEYIRSIIINKEVPESFVENRYEEFYNLLLNNYSENMGSIPKKMAAAHGSYFIRMFGENGKNISKLTPKQLDELLKYIRSHMELKGEEKKSHSRLREDRTNIASYSKWLYSFKNTEHDEEIEIPGQYDGYSKPFPEIHAMIASINTKLLILESLRKPKRITIYGTDEKEYNYLVKGGEDLRLDERIEQLFVIMNDMIKKNTFCSSQNVQIATYKVIPMASNLGIIEWVNNTAALQSCINSTGAHQILVKRAVARYSTWIESHTAKSSKESYGKYYSAFADNRERIVREFNRCSDFFPSTWLRDFVFKLASSPEAFLFLRKDFTYSLACISIFGYLLGIGDRHLQNFLLDMKSGRLIPIDFGYAFGAATELLPIPELIPFRLTRQLVGVLEPLGVSGILENAMTNILSAIQDQKESLLNVMSVFVKEPLLEWQKNAARMIESQRKKVQDPETLEQAIQWYPQNKIEIAKRKLNKENPANILIIELTNGHGNKHYHNDAVAIAKGVPEIDIRARVDDVCSETNEQVKCLINLATDPRALGVTWAGWQSYL